MENNREEPDAKNTPPRRHNSFLILAVLMMVLMLLFVRSGETGSKITTSQFYEQLDKNNIASVSIDTSQQRVTGTFNDPPDATKLEKGVVTVQKDSDGKAIKLNKDFYFNVQSDQYITRIQEKLEETDVQWGETPPDTTQQIISLLIFVGLPIGILVFVFLMIRRTRNDIMGGGFLSGFGKSPAKRFEAHEKTVSFKDVAGLEGVKADLQEIVDFLKTPEKFRKLGGRVPKGVLLNGSPGTGKTLLARAVAGEAEVPFFSVNGSEFIQMFVGVGASRVRDLFQTAKQQSPSIIFIDEIDAVGRQRGAGLGGGHDEREQTLNQILGEMDGFTPSQAVIVIAATNRPDVLDPALLRPGRFDRHITVNRPTLKGREEIFKVHVREVPLADDVKLDRLAAGTIGLTGADIQNMVNEAALWAARHDKKEVSMEDFDNAHDKILMGAKREEVLRGIEKEKTAYHEAGHTLTAWHLDGAHTVHKVTIIPRGRALGVTQYVPNEDRLNISKKELEHQLIVLLGGRAAEQIIYDEPTVGAENDLERATSIARRMVTQWGMSDKLGPVCYKTSEEDPFLGREMHQSRQFSEHTQELIDSEVAAILMEADKKAIDLLSKYRDDLETLTRCLIEKEELNEEEICDLIGPSIQRLMAEKEKAAQDEASPESSAADPTEEDQADQSSSVS